MEIEIGRGKKARRAYGFDDIAIVPSRRTRDPDDVDISWKLGDYRFELPLLASAMDGVVSPRTAKLVGKLGGLAVLNLEGIFTRYEDADEQLARIAQLPKEQATREMQAIYQEPIKPELIRRRIEEIKTEPGVVCAASLTPQRVDRYYELAIEAGLDILVIQGTVVSAEHVSQTSTPLNLKEFIREVDVPVIVGGCASYHTGLHLMRTGAAGVLVGVGPGAACTTRGVLGLGVPQATAIADVAGARSTHMLETGEYVQVIADGGMRTGGDVSKAIACGADVVGQQLAEDAALAHAAGDELRGLTAVVEDDDLVRRAGDVDRGALVRQLRGGRGLGDDPVLRHAWLSAGVLSAAEPLGTAASAAAGREAAAPREPIPTCWEVCSCLPSVCSDGAIISSARLNSARS